MNKITFNNLNDRIDSLQFALQDEIIRRSKLEDTVKILTEAIASHKRFLDEANLQITALTDQGNKTVEEMDKQIQFQHWFFEEMARTDDEPFRHFDPLPFGQKPSLKLVK